MPENSIYTFGDSNINLQNIESSTVTIIIGDQVKPEVKSKKLSLNNMFTEIIQKLAEFERQQEAKENLTENIDIDLVSDVQWDNLLESIEQEKCIVFIGPEISTDTYGNSLHENFIKLICNKDLIYSDIGGFFMPGRFYSTPNNYSGNLGFPVSSCPLVQKLNREASLRNKKKGKGTKLAVLCAARSIPFHSAGSVLHRSTEQDVNTGKPVDFFGK
jgi:hypothetical protein